MQVPEPVKLTVPLVTLVRGVWWTPVSVQPLLPGSSESVGAAYLACADTRYVPPTFGAEGGVVSNVTVRGSTIEMTCTTQGATEKPLPPFWLAAISHWPP